MEITIMCDQKDCVHNAGHDVHHDHLHDKCEHYNPQIHANSIKGGPGIVCLSKNIGVTKTGALLHSNPKTL